LNILVLLHGWGTDGHVWRRQVEAFGEEEMGGGGQGSQTPAPSSHKPASKRLTVLAPTIPAWDRQWLVNYLGNLPLQDTAVVGWSLGGMLLIEALAEMGVAVAALVLVAAPPVFCRRPDYSWGQPPGAVRAMRRALLTDPRLVLEDFAARCLGPGEEDFRGEVAPLFAGDAPAGPLAQGLTYLLRRDLRPLLPRLSGRVAIIQGDQDRIVPRAQAEFLHRHLPGSNLVILPGAGHLPFWTQAADFNQILGDIIRKDLGGGPGA
jgi:pimeloyl-[acyl-carrier protein] methyl ester esterase